jgi:hypothetical protein
MQSWKRHHVCGQFAKIGVQLERLGHVNVQNAG